MPLLILMHIYVEFDVDLHAKTDFYCGIYGRSQRKLTLGFPFVGYILLGRFLIFTIFFIWLSDLLIFFIIYVTRFLLKFLPILMIKGIQRIWRTSLLTLSSKSSVYWVLSDRRKTVEISKIILSFFFNMLENFILRLRKQL